MDAHEEAHVVSAGPGYTTERGTKSLAGYPEDRGLSLREVQQVVGRAGGTILSWVKKGRLHPTKCKGRLVFPRAEIEVFLKNDRWITISSREFWGRVLPNGSPEAIDALVAAQLADNPFEAFRAAAAKYQL